MKRKSIAMLLVLTMAASMFAGCGGLSLGMEQAGFTSIFFNEIIPTFASTYQHNRNL